MTQNNTTESAGKGQDRHSERTKRAFPRLSIRRCSLMIVLGTMMVGQVVMLRDAGIYAEVKELYEIAVWFLFAYGFWPQVQYGLSRAFGVVAGQVDRRGA